MKISYLLADDGITPIRPAVSTIPTDPGQASATLGKLVSGIVGFLLVLASIWVIFQLLQGGLEWIGSGGDKTGVENARNRITNALVGLFIVFASWAIYLLVLQFLGIASVVGGSIILKMPVIF